MTRSAALNVLFGDGMHHFRLDIARLEELQDKTGVGPEMIFKRLLDGDWRVSDVRETIRCGLIGGGMKPIDAFKLVDRYAVEGWLQDAKEVALNVILAALVGTEDEEVREGNGPGETADLMPISPTKRSTSPASTETRQSLAGRRSKSGG